jgi:serine/threonine-protein kinase
VSDIPSRDRPKDPTRQNGPPLRLADSDPADPDSTDALPEASGSSVRPEEGSSSSGPAVGPGDSSTGGFDTVLGRLVAKSGLATEEEVELCRTQIEAGVSAGDPPRTLADLLVQNEFLTRRQLDRLRSEFEARKSSRQIPGYQILKRLGSGAMATVFKARQLSLDRPVAIKVLPRRFSDNEKFIERFYKEGRAAAKLNHPNIVGAYDVGRAGEHHYFVMEFVDGETLHDRIVRDRRIDEKEATGIVKQVAQALQHAHERGFVHRDIKPKNIMIGRDGSVKLADLGLARALSDKESAKAEAGRAYGTPYYISPEQIRGSLKITPAADLYGLGATFYHMVTGKVPFEGRNPSEVMHRHLKKDLVPPDHVNLELSPGCAQVIEMLMAKNPGDRYRSAADLIEDLGLILAGKPPHFAHRSLDLSAISPALATPGPRPAAVPVMPDRERAPAMDRPLLILLLALLGLSVIGNLIFLVAWIVG